MDEPTLHQRQQVVKTQFDDLAAKKAQKDTEVDEMVVEMNRLQGEWRLLDNLRKELADGTSNGADTVVATPEKAKAKSGK